MYTSINAKGGRWGYIGHINDGGGVQDDVADFDGDGGDDYGDGDDDGEDSGRTEE